VRFAFVDSWRHQWRVETICRVMRVSARNCYDNAAVETFFKSLKAELIWRQSWPTRRKTEAAIFQYINGFYNTRRRHLYRGCISPLAFEAKVV
jgi:transposase InsO family protein